jgi:predicted MFS family arabinose efflux permease
MAKRIRATEARPTAQEPRWVGFALIGILSIGQIIGWGTTFYLPAVLGDEIGRELGVTRETVFLGVTLMVAIGALLSPSCGRLMDRHGASPFLPLGSLLIGVGLLQFAALPTRASALLATTLFGVATPISLSFAAVTLLAQRTSQDARRNIAIMMLFTGLSASVFWPIASILDAAIAWRNTVAVFAAANLCLAMPMYLGLSLGLRRRYPAVQRARASAPVAPGLVDGKLRRRAQWLMVIAFSLQGFGAWGLPLHLISLFAQLGVPASAAVGIAALNGPATIAARLAEIAASGRLASITTATIAAVHIPLAFVLLLAPIDAKLAATLFTAIYFGANGVMSVARLTLPLTLLGPAGYGALMGNLALPQNLVFAAAPFLFAVAFRVLGFVGGTLMALALSLAALIAVAGLAHTVHQAQSTRA